MSRTFTENIARLSEAFPPVMHLFHNLAGQVSRVGEFSLAQYRVLMLVYHEESLSINELKERLNIAQSTASGMVDRLVQQDLLRREKSKTDRRITVFELTPKAKKILQQRMSSMQEVYRRVLEPLNIDEQNELVHAFETILRLMRKVK